MEHTKKYVLMDPTIYARHCTQNVQEKVESHTIPNRQSNLDIEVRDILEAEDPDDVKAKKYSMTLKKYRDIAENAAAVAIASSSAPVDSDTAYSVENVNEADTLESVPSTSRYKAKRILTAIRHIPELSWNERGELVYRQSTIPQSNIVELVSDILKSNRKDRPIGRSEFAEGLATSNQIGKDLIANNDSWKIINHRVIPPHVSVTPVITTDQSTRKLPPRDKRKRRSSNWVTY